MRAFARLGCPMIKAIATFAERDYPSLPFAISMFTSYCGPSTPRVPLFGFNGVRCGVHSNAQNVRGDAQNVRECAKS
jgi:hypothetical protein